jgi:hypothetical protein
MKKPTASKTTPTQRAAELTACELEIMRVFKEHSVTLPEALFMFDKIRFHSFLEITRQNEAKHASIITGEMYR